MSETTATHKHGQVWWEDEYAKLVDILARIIAIKEDAMKRDLTVEEGEFIEMVDKVIAVYYDEEKEIPTGWLCLRCGAVNAPDVRRCDCEPGPEDLRRGTLPNTVVGPSETK
ncbi:MAG: hypothetical protein AMJ81_00175 [Phycisphaerae bacterium SM23_33]|nr:MAG: hypothetical protein AMJ81_00175 [Phycisphaerae bacterium SM23_33]